MKLTDKTPLTDTEIVNVLKRSFMPTLVIEGNDDLYIYHWLKKQLDVPLVSLLPCGGRQTLFKVFNRRDEFLNSKVIFIADQDLYRFTGIPKNKEKIVFTSGYCIENDVYLGSNICSFLDDEDIQSHEALLDIITKWFSFEIEKYLDSLNEEKQVDLSLSKHINEISPRNLNSICPNFANKISYKEPSTEVLEIVRKDLFLNLRGKQLFQMLSRFLSNKGRFSTFTDKNLIEIALKQGNNPFISELTGNISSGLKQQL